MRELFVTRPSLPPLEEYKKELESVWGSGIVTNCGPKHELLEKILKERTGSSCVKLFSSGHAALECALSLIKDDDAEGEVITTPFTFVSTVNAIERCGLKPVFCEIDKKSLTIDPSKIEEKITGHTKAIMPVHVYGNLCDHKKIAKIAKAHGLYVIYDAAHAFAEKAGAKDVATLGDISAFSFHATKTFGCAEGGAIFINCKNASKLGEKASNLRNFGLKDGESIYAGGNGKMSELSAALGLCNLRHIDEYIAKREAVAAVYGEKLSGSDIKPASFDGNGLTRRNHTYFPVIFKSERALKKAFKSLEENRIHARRYFYPCVHEMRYYREKYGEISLPVAERVSKRILCLPLSADMSAEEASFVCKILLG
ncbi:MAG: DegT/DnrJ/EryC1/StrS family aminotransferase [Clostridia bacterium]|nr:DegT/DnrJ/EryC1/StrS family aminotransferase [Clostridia bacterium]